MLFVGLLEGAERRGAAEKCGCVGSSREIGVGVLNKVNKNAVVDKYADAIEL